MDNPEMNPAPEADAMPANDNADEEAPAEADATEEAPAEEAA